MGVEGGALSAAPGGGAVHDVATGRRRLGSASNLDSLLKDLDDGIRGGYCRSNGPILRMGVSHYEGDRPPARHSRIARWFSASDGERRSLHALWR